jgi:hypothetical protein
MPFPGVNAAGTGASPGIASTASSGLTLNQGLFLAGTAIKAVSIIQQGRIADAQSKVQKALAERNAQVLEADAKAREQKARFDQLRQVKAAGRVKGALIAKLGASGARLDVGAPLDVITEQAAELELDNLLIGFEGATDAARLRDDARLTRVGGQFARDRGRAAKRASFTTAGVSLLRDFGTARKEQLV